MTDNGVSFRSHRCAKALRRLGIKHKRIKPYTPKPTARQSASCRRPGASRRKEPEAPSSKAGWSGDQRVMPKPMTHQISAAVNSAPSCSVIIARGHIKEPKPKHQSAAWDLPETTC